jgi:hypothetical protein
MGARCTFTIPLIASWRATAMKLPLSWPLEGRHHVETIARQQQNAILERTLLGALAGSLGTSTPETINSAQQLERSFWRLVRLLKGFELEADALGARFTELRGFAITLVGAQFFFRIQRDRFLGTHQPMPTACGPCNVWQSL